MTDIYVEMYYIEMGDEESRMGAGRRDQLVKEQRSNHFVIFAGDLLSLPRGMPTYPDGDGSDDAKGTAAAASQRPEQLIRLLG